MKALRSCTLAFAMYSKLPMPRHDWDEENMELVFAFFPLVGGAVGLALLAWWELGAWLELHPALTAAGCVAIPLLLTGGIHLDGLCDTADALASHQSVERKLEILKDSHVGAFALIACAGYLLVQFGVWCQGAAEGLEGGLLAIIPVLSRTLSAHAAVNWKNARGSGMLAAFTDAQRGRTVKLALWGWTAACIIALLAVDLLYGGVILIVSSITFAYYYWKSSKEFGGITGDLAGWFLQLCELACVLAVVMTERVVNAL